MARFAPFPARFATLTAPYMIFDPAGRTERSELRRNEPNANDYTKSAAKTYQFPIQKYAPMRHLLLISALLCSPHALAEPLRVLATFSILGDLVQQVGGDKVRVQSLVGPNADAHVYQPRPSDATQVAKAQLLVVNGLGFEGWLDRLVRASAYKGIRVTASNGISTRSAQDEHGHGGLDPHAWQDPRQVQRYVANIAQGLSQADPSNRAYYQQRAEAYTQQLIALEQWAQGQLSTLSPQQKRVITSHEAFAYLGQRFDIQFLAPQGLSTEAEASAKGVGKLITQMRQQKIRALFVEKLSNPKLIEQISREGGASVGPRLYSDALSLPTEPAGNYLAMMRYNISTLLDGMRKN